MLNPLLIFGGKLLSVAFKITNVGNGSTWPGHIALTTNKRFVRDILQKSQTKTIIVAGTNGKTTTAKLIAHILEAGNNSVLQNISGANLLNGLASAILLESSATGKLTKDYAVFEVDENALPLVLKEITPDYIVLLNLFRDQLDRYGEVNAIATKWKTAVEQLTETTTIILNADDPQITYLAKGSKAKKSYFGCSDALIHENKKHIHEHAVDSTYCPNCGEKLQFKSITFSHLGDWNCKKCGLKRPTRDILKSKTYPLSGMYNKYNTHAAIATAKVIGIDEQLAEKALLTFTPAFGRQEHIMLKGREIQIFLSKNPTGFNESLRTSKELGAKHIFFILNDRIPDGRDVSWIWDTDIENLLDGTEHVYASGDRAYDMAVRLKYAHPTVKHVDTFFPSLDAGLKHVLENIPEGETLYVLPTYTAMLETRKILTGKKIL